MNVDLSKDLLDLDGTAALEQYLDKTTQKPKVRPLTGAHAVMEALNSREAPEGEKMERYEIIKKIRANAAKVELKEREPEVVRNAVQKVWPAFIYGQICELLNLK